MTLKWSKTHAHGPQNFAMTVYEYEASVEMTNFAENKMKKSIIVYYIVVKTGEAREKNVILMLKMFKYGQNI